MKILITGGSGLLGQYLNRELSGQHIILSLYRQHTRNCKDYNSARVDITNRSEIQNIFNSFRPDIVIHTAAVSNPMLSSQVNSRNVYDINVNATKNIAELCAENHARLIYTSTDLVYARYRGSMLNEESKMNPLSLYAETKLMGEVKIKEAYDNFLILRVALLYGYGLHNSYNHFHQTYLNLKDGIPVKLFTDQFRTPVEISNAASIINELIIKNITQQTINLGGKQRVSRFQLGEILCDIADIDKKLLLPVAMEAIPDLPKVEDVSLDTTKLRSYGISQKGIEESVKDFLNNYIK